MQRAGELVDLRAFDLVAGVVEEVGHAAQTHSVVSAMCRQRQEGSEVGSAPVKHEAEATLGVQLELVEQDVVDFAKDGLEVHALGKHAQRKKSLTDLHNRQPSTTIKAKKKAR